MANIENQGYSILITGGSGLGKQDPFTFDNLHDALEKVIKT
jgi:molybdopterin biosynthesis enzyme MoaB